MLTRSTPYERFDISLIFPPYILAAKYPSGAHAKISNNQNGILTSETAEVIEMNFDSIAGKNAHTTPINHSILCSLNIFIFLADMTGNVGQPN